MNYDQIVRELKKLEIELVEQKSGASKRLIVKFNRKESTIEGNMNLTFILNRSKDFEFNSAIYEEPKILNRRRVVMNPRNQTEFFNVIKELKTTNTSLRLISRREDIEEVEKEIKKLTTQFKDTRFRLGERKVWLKYLKGRIDMAGRKEVLKKLAIQRDRK